MKRTIQDLFDLETGEFLKGDDLLNKSQKEIFLLRRKLEIWIQQKTPHIVCALCHQPVKLRAGLKEDGRIVHFAHLKDSSDCPIKTDTRYSKGEWLRMMYHGSKESPKHINMKKRIKEILDIDHRFSNIKVEKAVKDINERAKWKKPDIQCIYENKVIVFEMQISHTFLSEIVARDIFYDINEIPLYWICDQFYPNFDYLKVFHCDILYHHNCNLITFDDAAYKYSLEKKRLSFKVFWLELHITNNQVLNNWCQKIVDISEINYDKINKRLFYFDFEANELKIKKQIIRIEKYHARKERIFDTIRKLDINYSLDHEYICMKEFTIEINSMEEFNLPQWKEQNDIDKLFFLFRIFLSIRENKFYGYKIQNIIQLLNIFYSKKSVRDLYWLLIKFVEKGNHIESIKRQNNYKTFLKQKNKCLASVPIRSDKYTEYLHWFFKELG